jgi:hypothetical protein
MNIFTTISFVVLRKTYSILDEILEVSSNSDNLNELTFNYKPLYQAFKRNL